MSEAISASCSAGSVGSPTSSMSLSDTLPRAKLRPLLATPAPTLATPPTCVPSTRPSPSTSLFWCCDRFVADALPVASAPPVPMWPVPSETFDASPALCAVTGPIAVSWVSHAVAGGDQGVLVEVAVVLGEVADRGVEAAVGDADAGVGDAADLGARCTAPNPSTVLSVPWPKNVLDTLPWPWAPPVRMVPRPSEALDAVPLLSAVTGPITKPTAASSLFDRISASCSRLAPSLPALSETLPTAQVQAAVGHAEAGVDHAADLRVEGEAEAVDVPVGVLREVGGRRVAGGLRRRRCGCPRCRRRRSPPSRRWPR